MRSLLLLLICLSRPTRFYAIPKYAVLLWRYVTYLSTVGYLLCRDEKGSAQKIPIAIKLFEVMLLLSYRGTTAVEFCSFFFFFFGVKNDKVFSTIYKSNYDRPPVYYRATIFI